MNQNIPHAPTSSALARTSEIGTEGAASFERIVFTRAHFLTRTCSNPCLVCALCGVSLLKLDPWDAFHRIGDETEPNEIPCDVFNKRMKELNHV